MYKLLFEGGAGKCVLALVWGTIIQPASYKMPWLWFKIGREFHVTQAGHEVGTARVETAARGWVDQAGRLTGRNFLEGFRVSGIRVRRRGEQRPRIGMERILQ